MADDEGLTLTLDLIADAVVTASANRLLLIALIEFLRWNHLPDMDPLRDELPTGVSPDLAEANPAAADMLAHAIADANRVLDGLDEQRDIGDELLHESDDGTPDPANDR